MLSRIRDVRKAKGLTLANVAENCDPPTTAQTIGRLETGTRTLSIGWLNRIADALDVDSAELVRLPEQQAIQIAAILKPDGCNAPTKPEEMLAPSVGAKSVAMRVSGTVGEYRAGDELWLERMEPDDFGSALNLDILVPRPAGRFIFARLLGREDGKLHLLPLEPGARQQVVNDPPWIAKAIRLIRKL